jgi:hypothetical protein
MWDQTSNFIKARKRQINDITIMSKLKSKNIEYYQLILFITFCVWWYVLWYDRVRLSLLFILLHHIFSCHILIFRLDIQLRMNKIKHLYRTILILFLLMFMFMFNNHINFITEELTNKIKYFDVIKVIMSIYLLNKMHSLFVDMTLKSSSIG